MSGNSAGGMKAKIKVLKKNPNHYQEIGRLGGQKGEKDGAIKGFAHNPELAAIAGKKGGQKRWAS